MLWLPKTLLRRKSSSCKPKYVLLKEKRSVKKKTSSLWGWSWWCNGWFSILCSTFRRFLITHRPQKRLWDAKWKASKKVTMRTRCRACSKRHKAFWPNWGKLGSASPSILTSLMSCQEILRFRWQGSGVSKKIYRQQWETLLWILDLIRAASSSSWRRESNC